ncbi:hypothetical protein BGZ46_005730 [Entomortierella lignicola]|nr:hypothetical protein BGZ46_005730 [Entomortierella lignicola]
MHGTSYFKHPAEYYRRNHWTYPDTLRLRGSVIPAVVTDVIIITCFSSVLVYIEKAKYINGTLNVPNIIVPALSVVVGLILAFRTNTAYDRYWEGRKLWANLDVQIRNFSRMIWVGMKEIPNTTTTAAATATAATNAGVSTPKTRRAIHIGQLFGKSNNSLKLNTHDVSNIIGSDQSNDRSISDSTLINIDPVQIEEENEKLVVIRLLLAFAVSVKHHLRQEFGTHFHDIEHLLPRDFEPCATTDNIEIKVSHDRAVGDRRRERTEDPWNIHIGNEDGKMSLPLEIAHGLCLWVIAENRAQRIEPILVGNLIASINAMTDIFTNMERIVFTPIPLAYCIHLRQVVYAYCLALPFTFLEALGWLTIPLMCLVSFTLFGIEAIGSEIENPFGKDENDLHMHEFCRDLKCELDYTVNLQSNVNILGIHN